jgi:hypothetical protein
MDDFAYANLVSWLTIMVARHTMNVGDQMLNG